MTQSNVHIVIRRYQPSDREAVETIFRDGLMEHVNPAFMYAMTQPLHITVSLFFYIGTYVMSGQSVILALVSGGAWISFVYFCCYEFYAGYIRWRLNTDMQDIPGYFLSHPDNCFWVAEAEMDGRPQVVAVEVHIVIRRYRPSDREAVETIFRDGLMEHVNAAFMYAMTQPLHITVSLFFYIGTYVMSGQSVILALVSGGAWIGLVYFCCYDFYASYVRARLNTDMQDIPGYFLSHPDNFFWVAEAEMDGRPQVLGMVGVEGKNDPGSDGKKYGELYRMIVSSTCRRSGIGLRLAKTAEDFCRERRFSKIKLAITSPQKAGMAFYIRLGFKRVLVHTQFESPKWMIWMTRATILIMQKNI